MRCPHRARLVCFRPILAEFAPPTSPSTKPDVTQLWSNSLQASPSPPEIGRCRARIGPQAGQLHQTLLKLAANFANFARTWPVSHPPQISNAARTKVELPAPEAYFQNTYRRRHEATMQIRVEFWRGARDTTPQPWTYDGSCPEQIRSSSQAHLQVREKRERGGAAAKIALKLNTNSWTTAATSATARALPKVPGSARRKVM